MYSAPLTFMDARRCSVTKNRTLVKVADARVPQLVAGSSAAGHIV
jgi:hypothetical protein